MGEMRCVQDFGRKVCREENLEFLGVHGRIILEWILGKWGGKVWTGFVWLRIGTNGGLLWTR